MFPWLFLWSPSYQFPWSGSVKQDIAPSTDAFFGSIAPSAGDGRIEKAVFEQASYGKQLGILSDVVLSLVARDRIPADSAAQAVEKLIKLHENIETIKALHTQNRIDAVIDLLEKLEQSDPAAVARIVDRFQARASSGVP